MVLVCDSLRKNYRFLRTLPGIHDKLDYVKKNVKANAILLSSILKSPEDSIDLGYDPIDFKAIDERLGDMKSFDDLRLAVHNKGELPTSRFLKVVIRLKKLPRPTMHSSHPHPHPHPLASEVFLERQHQVILFRHASCHGLYSKPLERQTSVVCGKQKQQIGRQSVQGLLRLG